MSELDNVEECAVKRVTEEIREERGYPKGTLIHVSIDCRCPRCSPRFI